MDISKNKLDKLDEINIIVTGDFCPHLRVEELCLAENYDKIYNNALPILKKKDLSITNLECPLTTNNNPIMKSGPHLVAHPKCIKAIRYGNFDVVTLANNHILDQGETGLKDTLKLIKNEGIKIVGAGANIEEASRPLYLSIKNRKIAILNFTENEFSIAKINKLGANPINLVGNYYSIIKAKSIADILLVIIHGGHEGYYLPSPQMVRTYRFFADLGATAIISHHTHCASGYELYNGAPIFYSLGNFIFDSKNKKHPSWYEGYFIKLTISNDSKCKISFFPYYQCRSEPGLKLMEGDEKNKFLVRIQEFSHIIENPYLLGKKWNEFCNSRKADYLSRMLLLNKLQRKILKKGIFTNFIIKKKKLLLLLNIVRCEAHRDILIEILENEIF